MIIKESHRFIAVLNRLYWRYKNRKVVFFLGMIIYTGFLIAGGLAILKLGYFNTIQSVSQEIYLKSYRYINRFTVNPERIYIHIKHQHFQKLAYKREVALTKGTLVPNSDDYVPGKIRYGGRLMDAKLRLKGALPDHWRTDKWSLRIKLKGENTLFGMKNFSIQSPRTKNYLNQWFILEALRREGIISVRYKFVDVTVNGKPMGIYAIEEHFDKRLIEHHGYREGPILRFNGNLKRYKFQLAKSGFSNVQKNKFEYDSFTLSYVDGYTNQSLSDPLYIKAISLLEAFRLGKRQTSEVFDAPKLAVFVAFKELFGSSEIDFNDLRFYYNPITSRLEPIGFDFHFRSQEIDRLFAYGGSVKKKNKMWVEEPNSLGRLLFKDERFFELYIKTLERIAEPAYLDTLFSDLENDLRENLRILKSEFPEVRFSGENFYRNQTFIRKALNPVKAIFAYPGQTTGSYIELELGNIQSLPLKIVNVIYKDSIRFLPVEETLLMPKVQFELVDYRKVRFALPRGNFSWSDTMTAGLKIQYQVPGQNDLKSETIYPWPRINEEFTNNDLLRKPPNFRQFDCLAIDDSAKAIFIKPGSWTITEDLVIPRGYTVLGGENTQLNLLNSAKILSYAPLEFIGSEENPLLIYSADSSGQGIAVLEAEAPSLLKHVIFSNLSNPRHSGWELTGAVTFYKSPVEIIHCQFVRNHSEDALNTFRSKFEIRNSRFSHTKADAFDADFCTGWMTYTTFENCGNDAIDASGSEVKISNLSIRGAGDKGISAGERSSIIAKQITIEKAEIAVASKDLSDVHLQDVQIYNSHIGVAAFQKKAEFGPAAITARNLTLNRVTLPHMIEFGSRFTLDKKPVAPEKKNVDAILYGAQQNQSSR